MLTQAASFFSTSRSASRSAAARCGTLVKTNSALMSRSLADVDYACDQQSLHATYFSDMVSSTRKVSVQPSGQQFEVEEGESILSAALRQDIILPYGCRNGACGSCKGKLLDGRVDYGVYQKRA